MENIGNDSISKNSPSTPSESLKLKELVGAIQDLSLARSLEEVMNIVKVAARELTGADGATFVLRDGDMCYYAEANAIQPLWWKGNRFPMKDCIGGWVMTSAKPAVIKDIYVDDRIPVDAYRNTFVKSMAMVPIRTKAPIGAIGNYWSSPHEATTEEIEVLQALADSTSIALENVELYDNLEKKVRERTRELESFTYSVSHDLKAPLRGISGFAEILLEDFAKEIPAEGQGYLQRIQSSASRMNELIEALLSLSRLSRMDMEFVKFDITNLARKVYQEVIQKDAPGGSEFSTSGEDKVTADPRLIRIVLDNLLGNAFKFSRKQAHPKIEFGIESNPSGEKVYFVRDNGAGFDRAHSENLFQPFRRFHSASDFEGTGIGLAIVQKVISRHGGRLWAESEVGKGSKFSFTLPQIRFDKASPDT